MIGPEWSARWAELLDRVQTQGRLHSAEVRASMERFPRWRFIAGDPSRALLSAAVTDAPMSIPREQTISAPHMVAILLEAAAPQPGDRCLEVGAGSGWLATLLADLVGEQGHVVSMEVFPELAELARAHVEATDVAERVEVVHGDGGLGHPEGAPYDVIILSCAAPDVPPALVEQASDRARIVAPIGGPQRQDLVRLTREGGKWRRDLLGACAFVPLVGEAGF